MTELASKTALMSHNRRKPFDRGFVEVIASEPQHKDGLPLAAKPMWRTVPRVPKGWMT